MKRVPTPSQPPEVRNLVSELHALFPEGTAHLAADYDGDLYLTFPVGHDEAVEVETYSTSTVAFFLVTHRTFHRTGGLSSELELGESSQLILVKAMVERYLAHIAEQQAKMEVN